MEKKTTTTTHGPSNIFYTLKTSRTLFFWEGKLTQIGRSLPRGTVNHTIFHEEQRPLQDETLESQGCRATGNGQCVWSTEQRDGSHAPFQTDTHPRGWKSLFQPADRAEAPAAPPGPPAPHRLAGLGHRGSCHSK